jgi:hypothetical protein
VTANGAGSEVQVGVPALSEEFGMIFFLGAFRKIANSAY